MLIVINENNVTSCARFYILLHGLSVGTPHEVIRTVPCVFPPPSKASLYKFTCTHHQTWNTTGHSKKLGVRRPFSRIVNHNLSRGSTDSLAVDLPSNVVCACSMEFFINLQGSPLPSFPSFMSRLESLMSLMPISSCMQPDTSGQVHEVTCRYYSRVVSRLSRLETKPHHSTFPARF